MLHIYGICNKHSNMPSISIKKTEKAVLEIIGLKSKHLDQIHTNKCYSRTAYEYTPTAKTVTCPITDLRLNLSWEATQLSN